MLFDVWAKKKKKKKRCNAYFFWQILLPRWTAWMKCGCQRLKSVVRMNEDMMYAEVCLIINASVTLYGTFSMLLWLINVPAGSVNTTVTCGLIIRRKRIICQDDWLTWAPLPGDIYYLQAVVNVSNMLWVVFISFTLWMYGCFILLSG